MGHVKLICRKVFPSLVWDYFRMIKQKKKLLKSFLYDYNNYFKYSGSYSNDMDTAEQLLGNIIKNYHVIEKGLTMPEMRVGFGQERIVLLCGLCEKYIRKYGADDSQLIHALEVISEYKKLHDNVGYVLQTNVVSVINSLLSDFTVPCSHQIDITKEDYFRNVNDNFHLFSNSRSSVRNYTSEEIQLEKILKVLDLACNTPSACNRQSWRTYIYLDRNKMNDILDIQGGNRGFGHMGNKLIVITAELGMFAGDLERNQAFIDGGMYAMNLLYALHYNEIACCILNCSNSKEKDKELRVACNIKESEVFIAMVVCGIPPKSFRIASSLRYNYMKTNVIIN